jgi:hypothetical protein
MKNSLKHLPVHSFVVGLYIIVFIFTRNMGEVAFSDTYRSIGIELVISCVLFGLSYLIFRSGRKAGVFTTFALVGLFTYGIIYGFLEKLFYSGHWPFSHIHRFLIAAFLTIYSLLFITLYRSKRPHFHLNYVLNVFVLVLFFLNLPVALLSYRKHVSANQQENPFLALNNNTLAPGDSLPDVYYIILDGYAGERTLRNFYSDSNPVLYQNLRKKGFYIADSSRTNYPFTVLSLSSSLNFGYLTPQMLSNTSPELIRNSTVNNIFKKAGYRVMTIESGFGVTENISSADTTIGTRTLNEFENRLLGLTILRLDELMGFSHYYRLKNELDRLDYFLNCNESKKFCFIHIVSPHPPFVMDSSGNRVGRSSVSDMAWEPRRDYWEQLQYLSKRVDGFVDHILSKSKKPPFIIIQSDHGPWIQDKNPRNVYEARSRILNAYYAPDSITKYLYPGITPVNSFRIIFSHLFNTSFPLLPDHPVSYADLEKDITFKTYND